MNDKTTITIQAYDNNAQEFTQRFMDLSLYKEALAAYTKYIKSEEKILDLGCGPGNVSNFLLHSNPSLKITGIDLSEKMIELAKQNVHKADFIIDDIRNIQNRFTKKFDHIIASFCLPFLYDDETRKFISGCSALLKEGGYMYLSTMMGKGYQYEIPSFSKGDEMFFNYYSKEFLEDCFNKNSLSIVQYSVQDYHNKDGSVLKDMIFFLQKKLL
ncbi:MAG: class I SAM-dependent methyltransferase [Spirochaetaceae bacterium]|nr:class I SAM-dependent methyltransferase [Spirochaetaceae bacterium]